MDACGCQDWRRRLGVALLLSGALALPCAAPGGEDVLVEVIEGIPAEGSWSFEAPPASDRFTEPLLGITGVPAKYSEKALVLDRSNPFLLRARCRVELAGGRHRFLLRSFNGARLFLDGKEIASTRFIKGNTDGHDPVPELPRAAHPELRPLPPGHAEELVEVELEAGEHTLLLEAVAGGRRLRPEIGELAVAVATGGGAFLVVGPSRRTPLSDAGWEAIAEESRARRAALEAERRRERGALEEAYWRRRHEIARSALLSQPEPEAPELPAGLPVQNDIDRFLGKRLAEAGVAPEPLAGDWAFLRRLSLDVRGVVPELAEVEELAADRRPDRRSRWIERLLEDPRWADHWVAYWQDVLAENPGLVKPKLNNTGPFRWWIHESFLDNKPLDRFATELILMEGSVYRGGPAGFAMATEDPAPMAAKAQVLAAAFLGIDLRCARCHDAPYHPYEQRDLFSLAALLKRGAQEVPAASTIQRSREEIERMAVKVTLAPGSKVEPAWPFREFAAVIPEGVLRNPDDSRERLAAVVTTSHRFAQAVANRLWKRYLGYGLIEPVDDWPEDPGRRASHPELLDYLARRLIEGGYDLKALARLILESHAYQRCASGDEASVPPRAARLFAGPARRRLSAEQIVDSLFLAAGKRFDSEELNLDVDGTRRIEDFLNLGVPRRAWEFTSLSNERDRPALSLPLAQSIADLLKTFGWRESRQDPITARDQSVTVLMPLILANGAASHRLTALCEESAITAMCLERRPLEELVRRLFLRLLGRPPDSGEAEAFTALLAEGYEERATAAAPEVPRPGRRRHAVSWSNHLSAEATSIKLELEKAAREGRPPTARLDPDWRERMEDALWALMNSPEFLFVP
jgi:hypothetical protein